MLHIYPYICPLPERIHMAWHAVVSFQGGSGCNKSVYATTTIHLAKYPVMIWCSGTVVKAEVLLCEILLSWSVAVTLMVDV